MPSSDWQFDCVPPDWWEAACLTHDTLFASSRWLDVLRAGFGTEAGYCWQPASRRGFVLSTFAAGPFRVAYWGMPAGGLVDAQPMRASDLAGLAALGKRADLVRIPVSGFNDVGDLSQRCVPNPETAIVDLQHWSEALLPSAVRRNVRRAMASELQLTDLEAPRWADSLHALYCETVSRRGGSVRYTREYFRALLSLAASHPGIRCLAAMMGSELAAFVVVAGHGRSAYYLHGACPPRLQNLRPMDLLFRQAIGWAQEQGLERFNMMASPLAQPSLVRFKEKWGGQTRMHRTYELALRPLRAGLFRLAERVHRRFR